MPHFLGSKPSFSTSCHQLSCWEIPYDKYPLVGDVNKEQAKN